MADKPEPETEEPETEERTCPACGGPYDQLPVDAHIPVCVACQYKASTTPTGSRAKLTR